MALTIFFVFGLKLVLNRTFNLTQADFSEKSPILRKLTLKIAENAHFPTSVSKFNISFKNGWIWMKLTGSDHLVTILWIMEHFYDFAQIPARACPILKIEVFGHLLENGSNDVAHFTYLDRLDQYLQFLYWHHVRQMSQFFFISIFGPATLVDAGPIESLL